MKSNRGMGWIRGILWFSGIMVFIVMIAAVLSFVNPCRKAAPKSTCLNNLKQIGTALNMYERDWDDRFPPLYAVHACAPQGKGWMDNLLVYARNKHITRCPSAPDRLTYSFNRQLSGIKEAKIAKTAETFAIFESVNAMPESNNLNGGEACHPSKDRIPLPGQYIVWPKDAQKLQRHWPDWARQNHEDVTIVVYADGHAKGIVEPCEPYLSLK